MAELAARSAKAPATGPQRSRKKRAPRVVASIASTAVPSAMRHALPPGGGQPLPAGVAQRMGQRFGIDFRSVRVHTGTQAQQAADEHGAAAYTIGTHIVFAEGRFDPRSPAGERLLAHELAHVVQQSRGGARPEPAQADAGIERAADTAAARVGAGDQGIQVTGASGIGVARAPAAPVDEATVRLRLTRAIGELQRLEIVIVHGQKNGREISSGTSARAFDAIVMARRDARALGDPTLVTVADELIGQYDAVTKGTRAARPGSVFEPHPAADTEPMTVDQATRAVTAQRGFDAGLGAGRFKGAQAQVELLESAAKAATNNEERTALRKKADALKRRIAISRPTLHDADKLSQQKTALEQQLATAKPRQQAHLRRRIEALQNQIDAVHAAQKSPGKVTLPALHGGPLGHSGSTNVTIQILGRDGKLITTVQARNDETRHAEVVITERLEALSNKQRFVGATMIVSGDQEVCNSCTKEVRIFAAKYHFKEAYGDTSHVPQITSGGKLTGKDATAKTAVGKMSDPAELNKVEQAQRSAGQIDPDKPVRRSFQRKMLYQAPATSLPAAQPTAAKPQPAAQQTAAKPDAAKPSVVKSAPPAAKTDAVAKPSAVQSMKSAPPPAKIVVPAQIVPPQGAKVVPPPQAADATPEAPIIKPGAAPGTSSGPGLGKSAVIPPGTMRSNVGMAAGTGVAALVSIIAVPLLNEYLQEHHAERFAEHARKKLAESLEAQRPYFDKFIRNHRIEIENAQAEGRTVSLHVLLRLDWQQGGDPDPIAGHGLSVGRVLMNVWLDELQLVHEGQKPKPYQPRNRSIGEELTNAVRTSIAGGPDTYERFDIELTGTNAQARRIREIDEALKKAGPDSDEAKALATEREALNATYGEFVKQRKAQKAAEAAREKAAKEKREKERLAQVIENDKFKASQKPEPLLQQLLAPPAPVAFGAAPKSQGQGLTLGPFDVSAEALPQERAELVAAAFERKRDQWVAYARKVHQHYDAKTLTDEQRERFRKGRDSWMKETRDMATGLREYGHLNAAGRMDEIVGWFGGNGHNALLMGI